MSITRRTFLGGFLAAAPSESPAAWTLAQAADAVRRKRISPVELTRVCLDRIDRLNPKLNAFITVLHEAALAEARAAESEIRSGRYRGPLHGIPVAVKDLFDTAGVRTTAASEQWVNRVPARDAEAVRRLREAGAVLLGKLNMDEFAYNFTSETSYFGVTRNPWDRERSPGGSSGGSAVAVATGMCYGALGSDTGGSIRLPAAWCGISGYKPTYGLVSTDGAAPLAWSLDHVGPMGRSVGDVRLLLNAITGQPLPDNRGKVWRAGIPRAFFYEKLEPAVETVVREVLQSVVRRLGTVKEITLDMEKPDPSFPVLLPTYLQVIAAESYAFHEPMLKANPGKYHAGTRRSIEGGASISAPEYIRARNRMQQLRQECRNWFREVDVLITPTAPVVAYPFGARRDLIALRNTAPFNLYGLPSISLPCGVTAGGLPVGLQITGAAGQDGLVLRVAESVESAISFPVNQVLRRGEA